MNKKFFITDFYFYLILIIFFLITLCPIISLYIKYLPTEYSLTLYNGSLDYPSRLPQYLPILKEFMESGIFFENSVNKDLEKINIENVRTIPFLIAILPSIFSQNLNFIITINYFLSFFLQLIVIYLITNFFLKSPKISLIASICIFFHLDYFTFNPIDVIKNIFFDLEYTISFSDISNNYEIIFQSLSNFLFLLNFYYLLMMRSKDYQSFKFLFVTTFSFLIFSYQSHLIISFLLSSICFFNDYFIKKIKNNVVTLFVVMLSIFTFSLIFHLDVMSNSSWTSSIYLKDRGFDIVYFFNQYFSDFSVIKLSRFFVNTYFLFFLIYFFLKKKIEIKFLDEIVILSTLLSFSYFLSYYFLDLHQRLIFRGSNIILTIAVFIIFFEVVKKVKYKILTYFSIFFVIFVIFSGSYKYLSLAHHNFTSNTNLINNQRIEMYDFINENFTDNTLVASLDARDWEMMPFYTDVDLYFSSIFNSYRNPFEELKKYLKAHSIFYSDFEIVNKIKDFKKSRLIYKNYVINKKSFVKNNQTYFNDEVFYHYLFSRNILGYTVFDGNLFQYFNNKKIPSSINDLDERFFTKEIMTYLKALNIQKVSEFQYLIINKTINSNIKVDQNFKIVFNNKNFQIFQNLNYATRN